MSGAPRSSRGERFNRPWLAVLVVGLAMVVSACGGTTPSPSPSGAPASAFLSVLDEIQPDGSVSKDTALRAFSLAFGPMPGVDLPAGDRAAPRSGTMALRWLVSYWDQLTPDQRTAAIALVPDLQTITAASSGMADTPLSAGFALPQPRRLPLTFAQQRPNSYYTQLAQDAVAEIGSRLKTPVNIGFTIDAHVGLTDKATSAAETAALDANGRKDGVMAKCVITISPAGDAYTDQADIDDMMAHEAWHCYEGAVVGMFHYWYGIKSWIMEGEAEWVGYSLSPTAAVGPWSWPRYLKNPTTSLFKRSYDAIGFYSQLQLSGVDVWAVLVPILQAADNEPAFVAAGAAKDSFLDIWAPGYLRDLSRGGPWEITGPAVTADEATPTVLAVPNGGHANQSADAYTNKISLIQPQPDVLVVTVNGHGRISDSNGTDEVISGAKTFCLLAGGCGDCPAINLTGSPIAFGLTGGTKGSSATFDGKSKEQFCPAPQKKPCNSSCGGSNGDPHLRTVDGSRYDLQAAGEYVMLRAPDGSVEIQARQEPRGANVTINTAVAARVNGHRVPFYVAEAGPPTVLVDGQGIDAGVAATDLGAGARLTQYQRGFELDFPDGTKLWALSLGSWGINLLVLPSNELRRDGRGLIAGVPSSAQFRVPALPDGSPLPAPVDRHDHYRLLYEVLAPAWRVTADTSLFDYDGGTTTDSFTVAGFPPETAPLTAQDIDQALFAGALQTCAAVTDSDLVSQCAFDVAITGESQFATLYLVSDALETQGTATLDQPAPTSAPEITPPPSQGPLPAGINFVADHLAGVSARLLAPNGRLYANVLTQAVAFGDVEYSVLAIDPGTGAIAAHAASAAPGMLAWADGSLWAGEFSRSEIGKCEISRLDPLTLAEIASVPTVCGDQLMTVFATVGDTVWFVDPTGAAADMTGAHLRRIDPATNALDPAAGSNLELPFLPQFVLMQGSATVWSSTSAGLIFGNRQHGLFRLLAGSDTFDSLGVPGNGLGWYAAGDGVWTETDTGENGGQGSAASFYNGGDQPALLVGFDGYLSGADDEAVYVDYQLDSDVADSLVRYPADGSAPTTVAVGGSVANSFGGTSTLGYNDSLVNPLLFSNGIGVKAWLAPSASDETMQQLLVQVLNLP